MKTVTFKHHTNVVILAALLAALIGGVVKPGALPLAVLLIVIVIWATLRIVLDAVDSIMVLLSKEED